jgi:hypothetical protein
MSRAQRQDLLIRTGAPMPVNPSSSLEEGKASPTFYERRTQQLMMELRRGNSLMNRPRSSSTRHYRIDSKSVVMGELDEAVRTTAMRFPPPPPPLRTMNHILLHIYDLIQLDTLMQLPFGCVCEIGKCFKDLNDGLHLMGTGAYHVGVEVNGVEYAFGACATPGKSGVFRCSPKQSPGYQYRTTVDFGKRSVVRRCNVVVLQSDHTMELEDDLEFIDGREILRAMAKEYMGIDYDILRKNCCTFARDACLRFGIKEEEIPSWFRNLSESGALTQDVALSLARVEPLKVFSSCESDSNIRESYEIRMGDGVRCRT